MEIMIVLVLVTIVSGIVTAAMLATASSSSALMAESSLVSNLSLFERRISTELRTASLATLSITDDAPNHILAFQVPNPDDSDEVGVALSDGTFLVDGWIRYRIDAGSLVREALASDRVVNEVGTSVVSVIDETDRTGFLVTEVDGVVQIQMNLERSDSKNGTIARSLQASVFIRN